MRGGVRDAGQTTEQTLKIELLSRWKLEAESRKIEALRLPMAPELIFGEYSQTTKRMVREHRFQSKCNFTKKILGGIIIIGLVTFLLNNQQWTATGLGGKRKN